MDSISSVDLWLKAIKELGLPIVLVGVLMYFTLKVLSTKLDIIIRDLEVVQSQVTRIMHRLQYGRWPKSEDDEEFK